MASTHAPKMNKKNERIAIGKPEKGVMMMRTPRRMSVLERDIRIVYRR